jgi:hypothetical protein
MPALLVSVLLSAVLLGACADSDEDSGAAGTSSTTTPETTASTAPLDHRSAFTARLAEEWDDPALAEQIVGGLDEATLEQWEAKVPLSEVADSELLTYQVPTVPDDEVDSIVAFAFGYRDAADGSRDPGGPNEAMAEEIAAFVAERPVPVFAQTEIAELLEARQVPDVVSIDAVVGPDGNLVYLSTAGAAEQVVEKAGRASTELGTVGVVCFADHLGRCVLTAEAAGMDAVVPEGITPPTAYDPQSAQPWTTSRANYLAIDLAGRLATV